MMGSNDDQQAQFYYEFDLEELIPQGHLLRHMDRFLNLAELRTHLAPFYSHTGRPSIDPELMIRILIIGYCYGIRSERRLCDEVKLNLAYRNKETRAVIDALIRQAHKLPRELYKSLTWDRGKELADHPRCSLATDVKVYFRDPHSPWQRGSNEQTNGLLRQYFPKGMDLSNIHQNRLNAVARQLNERPRMTLGYYSPAEKFAECVASIG
jgi:hypothetical protein